MNKSNLSRLYNSIKGHFVFGLRLHFLNRPISGFSSLVVELSLLDHEHIAFVRNFRRFKAIFCMDVENRKFLQNVPSFVTEQSYIQNKAPVEV
jgi:hypothetical protein